MGLLAAASGIGAASGGVAQALADGTMALAADLLERAFGPGVRARALGSLTWADLALTGILLVAVLAADAAVAVVLRRSRARARASGEAGAWRHHLLGAVAKPLHLLVWIAGAYVAAAPVVFGLASGERLAPARAAVDEIFGIALFGVLLWLFFRVSYVLERRLDAWTAKTENKIDNLVAPLIGRSLRVVVPVVGVIFALPMIGLPAAWAGVVAKASSILVIGTVAWILFQGVHLGERAVLAEYDIGAADNLKARKVYTQVHVISKTLYVLIAIFTVASVLMLFDEVRRFGASILASAGVMGIVLGFAAQRTIANLFAGFQIALTQPIRIDDVVIVDGEWGRVEEITLTYVVIHIWDDRRLVVPLGAFIEKPFQNWTRVSAQLLGSVLLWTDYTLPLAEVRRAVKGIVEGSALWDRRFWNLQVVDASERAMQIRVLATAEDSSKAWDLRCEIREKLISYIQERYPEALPRTRVLLPASVPEAALPR